MPTHRIGVNLLWLVPGVVGGSEEATTSLLRAVGDALDAEAGAPDSRGDAIELVLIGTSALFDAYPELAERYSVLTVEPRGANRVARVVAENRRLASTARSAGVSFLHHAGGVVPPGCDVASTVTVHDVQPLDLPENFGVVKRTYLRALIGRSVHRAKRTMVPSAFVRDRLVERTGADPQRIDVVPWALPRSVLAASSAAASAATGAAAPSADSGGVVDRLGLGGRPFVLYPAITYPHKNHRLLCDVAESLGAEGPAIVLTGGVGAAESDLRERIAALPRGAAVVRLARVPRADLDVLFDAAAAVVVPSRYEGFGLPALEAMAHGRPVVVSSAGSLPEVVGDAGLVVDPDDVPSWADAVVVASTPGAERDAMIRRGLRQAATCTAERSAAAFLRSLRTAVNS